MTTLARRDRLGARRVFFDPVSGAHASTLAALLSRVPAARRSGLDPRGVAAAWGLADAPDRTCLCAIRAVPQGHDLVATSAGVHVTPVARSSALPSPSSSGLGPSLVRAAAAALRAHVRPVLALGGGLDAPLALLAARRAGVSITEAIHVSLPGTTYDESRAARQLAVALDLTLHELTLTTSDLAGALSRAVRDAETPLYNLHPVSRALVAQAARARGHDVLVTGDGADQAARGATERADYVPLVVALTEASDLALAAPLLDAEVVDLLADARDPDKIALRRLSVEWGFPVALAERAKTPCSAPPLPRDAFPGAAELACLSRALDRPLAWSDDDRANVGIASLAAFVRAFELGDE